MIGLKRRIEALEAMNSGRSDAELVRAVLEREADPTAWLMSAEGDGAEKAALIDHILKQVDGRSKGLPRERMHQ